MSYSSLFYSLVALFSCLFGLMCQISYLFIVLVAENEFAKKRSFGVFLIPKIESKNLKIFQQIFEKKNARKTDNVGNTAV